MRSLAGTLAAPFPYFGVKSLACAEAWEAMGDPTNYVEPFAGSAAMLLGRPNVGKVETINDADGFVSNFWRAVIHDADSVAKHLDYPVNEADLFSRHSWLVRNADGLLDRLHADPDYYEARSAAWWAWGACSWIGSGWCSGKGPWIHDGTYIVDARQLPHLSAGMGINRKLPHLSAGMGINRKLPHLGEERGIYIREWMLELQKRLRNVRVACGDWERVLSPSVTTRHGVTGVFLDPPYTKGAMDYAAGGVGGEVAGKVREWCKQNGDNEQLRIVLCGHAGEHDDLLSLGWSMRTWKARKGYALTKEATANSASETLWCSPACAPKAAEHGDIFKEAA